MPTEEPPVRDADNTPPRMQFSLWTLLVLPVLVATTYAVLFATPPAVMFFELATAAFVLPAILATMILYGEGYNRTFCIGALVPLAGLSLYFALLFATYLPYLADLSVIAELREPMRLSCAGAWATAMLSGLLCVGVRYSIESKLSLHRVVLGVILLLLMLAGPILGKIGVYQGWWEANRPSVSTGPAPVPYGSSSGSGTYAYPVQPTEDASRTAAEDLLNSKTPRPPTMNNPQ